MGAHIYDLGQSRIARRLWVKYSALAFRSGQGTGRILTLPRWKPVPAGAYTPFSNPNGGCYEIQNTKCEKLGDSAVFQKLILGFLQTQDHLSGHQSGYQIQVAWFSSQCGCSKQSNGIGQQAHHPGQAQAVKKNLTESKLVFLIGLTGFDP